MRDALKIALGVFVGIVAAIACVACVYLAFIAGLLALLFPGSTPEVSVSQTPVFSQSLTPEPTSMHFPTTPLALTPTSTREPVVRVGDTVPEFDPDYPALSLTFLEWRESNVAVDGPYAGGDYYVFTARPGMKFVILVFQFQNNWVRPQDTPYLSEGEVLTDKGYFYPAWDPPMGIHSEEYAPRQATEEEVEALVGSSGGFVELLPEETIVGRIGFEVPMDERPLEVRIIGVPYLIELREE